MTADARQIAADRERLGQIIMEWAQALSKAGVHYQASLADVTTLRDRLEMSGASGKLTEMETLRARNEQLETVLVDASTAIHTALGMVEEAHFIPNWDYLRQVRERIRAALSASLPPSRAG